MAIDPNKPLDLISYAEIMEEDLPPVAWLVDGLIAQGDCCIVYGEYGCMKSWVLLDLGLHIAAGKPWLGQFPVPHPQSVLYLDEEMHERTLRRRIKRLGTDKTPLPFMALSRKGVKFEEAEVSQLLASLIESGFDPDVVIVETLRRVMQGDEREAEAVATFWRNVQPILRAGKTLIVSHHMRKPNAQGRDDIRYRASGSTDLMAGPDTAFAMERATKDRLVVACIKSRNAEEPDPFVVSVNGDSKDSPMALRFEGFQQSKQDTGKLKEALPIIVDILSQVEEHKAKASDLKAILATANVTKRTAEAALALAVKLHMVDRIKKGWYQLPEKAA